MRNKRVKLHQTFYILLILLFISILSSCSTQKTILNTNYLLENKNQKFSINGKVEFPELNVKEQLPSFSIKATLTDIATSATVSLINPSNNTTIATTLTGQDGMFYISNESLKVANANFTPQVGTIYILEAIKRIGGVGNSAMSIRTNIKYIGNNFWESITTPNIMINQKTTALSIMSNLNPSLIATLDTIGKMPIINGLSTVQTINSHATEQRINDVKDLVVKSLEYNRDPVHYIKYINNKYSIVNPVSVPTSPNLTTNGGGTWNSILKLSVAIIGNVARFTITKEGPDVPSLILSNPKCPNTGYFEYDSTATIREDLYDTGRAIPLINGQTSDLTTFPVTGCNDTVQSNSIIMDVDLLNEPLPKDYYVNLTTKDSNGNLLGNSWVGPVSIVGSRLPISLEDIVISTDNGDSLINIGETVILKPVLKNVSLNPTNELYFYISSTSNLINVNNPYFDPANPTSGFPGERKIGTLATGDMSQVGNWPYTQLTVTNQKALIGDGKNTYSVPIVFTIYDRFGNTWNVNKTIKIEPIANNLTKKLYFTDVLGNGTNGNGDSIINIGETVTIKPEITNSGTSKTNDLYFYISSTSNLINVNNPYFDPANPTSGFPGERKIGTIAPGAASQIGNWPYTQLTVTNQKALIGDGKNTYSVPIIYTIYDKLGNVWNIPENMTINPIANILDLSIVSISGGNGDSIVNKGETITIKPTIINTGTSSTNELYFYISSTSNLVNVNNPYFDPANPTSGFPGERKIGTLATGATSQIGNWPYSNITGSNNITTGTSVPIVYTIYDKFGNVWNNIPGNITVN